MEIKIKKHGNGDKTITTKMIADYISGEDLGRDDYDGVWQKKVEENIEFVKNEFSAVFHSGTFLGFECDIEKVFNRLDP